MIYRIAIYRHENGRRKFDHYATAEELKYLRVNAEGKVERLHISTPTMGTDLVLRYEVKWLDSSATHEVEWGFVQNNKPYYVNDRLESKNEETIYYDTKHQCFAIGCRWLELRGENGETEICCDVCQRLS